MNLQCLSFAFKESSSENKSKFVLHGFYLVSVYKRIHQELGLSELLILSTCNRTEIYFFAPENYVQKVRDCFFDHQSITQNNLVDVIEEQYFETENSFRHLSLVAVGAESQVLGDIQVINQIKESYKKCVELGFAKALMHKALHRIFAFNKQVENQTQFKKGAVSISSAASQFIGKIANKKDSILVVGAGESNQETIKNLINNGYPNITIVNRTLEKAQQVSKEYGVSYANYDDLKSCINDSDVVITALSVEDKVLTMQNVPMEIGRYKYRYFVDLSVVSVVDEQIEQNPENLYFGINYMVEQNSQTIALRKRELLKVEELISAEADALSNWIVQYRVINKLQELDQRFAQSSKNSILDCLKEDVELNELFASSDIAFVAAQSYFSNSANEHKFSVSELYDIFNVNFLNNVVIG